jgi:hypothetical protein
MSDEKLGPIEPLKMQFPVPPVCTAHWEPQDWETWIRLHGSPEPLTLRYRFGPFDAVGRNAAGELVYRLNTDGEV